jgi:hypothetical protein
LFCTKRSLHTYPIMRRLTRNIAARNSTECMIDCVFEQQ